jgi:nitrite reductase/ring-hydroxylating ferredoxin subunit
VTPEEQPTTRQADALDEYVQAMLDGRAPRSDRSLGEQADALRMAALLSSAESTRTQPTAAFVERLRARFQAGQRKAWLGWSISRRTFARGVAGGVAALAVCLFGEQALQRIRGGEPVPQGWVPVARAEELPPGSVKRFVAGEVEGHVMNIGGRIWALSAICTHMPCPLDWKPQEQEFACRCHPAVFNMRGEQTGIDDYKTPLPALPKIPVQQLDGTIYLVPAG